MCPNRNSIFQQNSKNNESKFLGKDQTFKILHLLHFTSERKRMGILIRDECHKIYLLIKGADEVIIPRTGKYPYISVQQAVENLC